MPETCRHCPTPVDPGQDLCPPCEVELSHRVMNAEPDPHLLKCRVCEAPFTLIEARVLRFAKNPLTNLSAATPYLCWVCTRLYHSAHQAETFSIS
jgi:hypothetical protein